jgi:hypothetical protein
MTTRDTSTNTYKLSRLIIHYTGAIIILLVGLRAINMLW